MNRFLIILLVVTTALYSCRNTEEHPYSLTPDDSSRITSLNEKGFSNRLVNPELSIKQASEALELAELGQYNYGIGEALRVLGVAKYYLTQMDEAIKHYLLALSYFKEAGSREGEAKVYNNIGNLYKDNNYEKSLENFYKALSIAKELDITDLEAGLYLNIGTVHLRMNSLDKALSYYDQSLKMFTEMDNEFGLIQTLQNLGLVHLKLNDLTKATFYLEKAANLALTKKAYNSLASIYLTLSSVYINQEAFQKAEFSCDGRKLP